jgi:hypothetical protein
MGETHEPLEHTLQPLPPHSEPLSATGAALVQQLVSSLETLNGGTNAPASPRVSEGGIEGAARGTTDQVVSAAATEPPPESEETAALAIDCLLGLCDLDFRGTGGTVSAVIGFGRPSHTFVELKSVACVPAVLSVAAIRAAIRFSRQPRVRPKLLALLSALSAQRASAGIFENAVSGQGFVLLINSCAHATDTHLRFLATKGVRNLSRHGPGVRAVLHKRGAVTALVKACSSFGSALDSAEIVSAMEHGCGALANLALETGGKGSDDASARPREEMATSEVLMRALRGALQKQGKIAARQQKQLQHEQEQEREGREAELARLEQVIACATRAIANLCLLDAEARATLAAQHVAQPLVQICAASVGKGGRMPQAGTT